MIIAIILQFSTFFFTVEPCHTFYLPPTSPTRRSLQALAQSRAASPMSTFANLRDWCCERGAEWSPTLEVRDGERGRGVFATAPIKEGELLLRLPAISDVGGDAWRCTGQLMADGLPLAAIAIPSPKKRAVAEDDWPFKPRIATPRWCSFHSSPLTAVEQM